MALEKPSELLATVATQILCAELQQSTRRFLGEMTEEERRNIVKGCIDAASQIVDATEARGAK
jgi:hypothetical protein